MLIDHWNAPVRIRFWRKVLVDTPLEACWEWTGSRWNGYGTLSGDGGATLKAHRASWSLFRGEIPNGLHVLHHCDNRACVRPSHLFLGTNRDNMQDMVNKGRSNRGEKNGQSRLTEQLVRDIRAARKSGETLSSIAARIGVDHVTVWQAARHKRWGHVR